MSLFQKTIITKYLKSQNQEILNQKWDLFCSHFHNPEIQENIRNSKEEQYQGEFLIDLFVNVLGYTKNPTPNFNLTTEYKNIKDSKKADGAIIINDKVLAIIELKGTNTTDLSKIEDQAFGYKNNQPDCKYVVTSNFEKLRFYIDNAIEHLEFNLFELTKEQFELLYLCLAFENISADIPAKIKNESVSKEDEITKKLYKDYSVFKRELFNNLIKQNPEFDQLELFKKSQKLLDRLLFLFFGEDRGLLPPNSVRLILEQWNKLKELDEYVPLYSRFRKYFNYLNSGEKPNIFAYNGGLFKPDEILDHITIDDTLLYNHTLKLAEYDFASEVDVNILGHIFENSLNEIDEIKAQIEGQEIDKSKTKRKKDGVFYTPKYITKYIVENTVGKLCEEKKAEIGIAEEDYFTDKKRQQKTKLALLKKLEDYRTWLHQITIIDPACGSGAFLNEALNFLIEEHKYIDELDSKLNMKFGTFGLEFNIENSILENNLFGVDLNEESVEIAKLSLWLRTAKPNRKLNDLSNNIKCGNSLIDDPEIAGDKAFNWGKEFPQIFAKGGFDVVIGNPPYVRQELFKDIKPYLETNYKCYNSVADLYTYFIELGIRLINKNGKFSFILPNKFLKATYGAEIRRVIINNSVLESLLDFDDYPVFDDATTYPIIFILNKVNNKKNDFFYYSEINNRVKTDNPIEVLETNKIKVPYISLTDEMWNFINQDSLILINKLNENAIALNDLVDKKIYRGLTTGKNEAFVIDEAKKEELISKNIKNAELIKVLATGKEVKRNSFNFQNKYLLFTGYDNDIPSNYPDIQEELDKFKQDLIKRYDQGLNYWNLRACAYYNEMQMPKIIYPRINNQCNFYFDAKGEVFLLDNNFFISSDSIGLLGLLNSKLVFYYLKNVCTTLQGGFYDFRRDKISTIPIHKNFNSYEAKIGKISQDLIQLVQEFELINSKFQRNLQREFSLETLSKKLQNLYELSFADFLKELAKAKLNLTLSQKAEWEDYFLQEQKRAFDCQSKVHTTDKEIDQMVYELYGLTEDEIEIVEKS